MSNKPKAETSINWQAPWLAHLPSSMQVLRLHDLAGQLNALKHLRSLTTGLGRRLSFVAEDALPKHEAYETYIAHTGNIPTRDNLHDFFNAAVWLTFSKTKAVLNACQYLEIERAGVSNTRSKLRDALTVFDENGAVLVTAEPSIATALQAFNWQQALVKPRDKWDKPCAPSVDARACVYLFGHALMEQLVAPRKSLCAHTWIISVETSWFAMSAPERLQDLDFRLGEELKCAATRGKLTTRSLSPLPVLGVPHFWQDNRNASFYDDTDVFRPGRRRC